MLDANVLVDKIEAVEGAKANVWKKYDKERIYIEFDNKKFFIDLKKGIVTYGYGVKGNIWTIQNLLEKAGIGFEPLPNLYVSEIVLVKDELIEKAETFNRCKKEFGTVEFEGKEYALKQDAYVCGTRGNEYYQAEATDEEGTAYMVTWDILDLKSFEELEDESLACDWDNPVNVSVI